MTHQINEAQTPTIDLGRDRFRANPRYEPAELGRLNEQEREMLGNLAKQQNIFGVLRAKQVGQLPSKAICRDTALLWFSLQEPGLIPEMSFSTLGPDPANAVAQLVLGGVLEIQVGDYFSSGSDALELILPKREVRSVTRVAGISERALKYAQALATTDPQLLIAKLYAYNHEPITPDLRARFSSEDAIREFLTIDRMEDLSRNWHESTVEGWRSFSSRRVQLIKPNFKLYVSPTFMDMPRAMPIVVHVFESLGVAAFKVGRNLPDVLRPDKIVAYFDTKEHLEIVAKTLTGDLKQVRAQGVPFTAQIDEFGLLSWGRDPAEVPNIPGVQQSSWRAWVVSRLAFALSLAKINPSEEVEAWEFAQRRLQLDKIDPESWTPLEGIFNASN